MSRPCGLPIDGVSRWEGFFFFSFGEVLATGVLQSKGKKRRQDADFMICANLQSDVGRVRRAQRLPSLTGRMGACLVALRCWLLSSAAAFGGEGGACLFPFALPLHSLAFLFFPHSSLRISLINDSLAPSLGGLHALRQMLLFLSGKKKSGQA